MSTGIGADGTTNIEAYLATYAVAVPVGAVGTWTLFLEDAPDNPGDVLMVHDAFRADSFFVDINTPLKIRVVTDPGRCCGHPGGALGCVDGITGDECFAAGGAAFTTSESCAGADDDDDGVDEACDNCNLFNPDQTDCQPNGVGDVCEIAADPSIDCPDGIPNGIPDECEEDWQAAGEPGCGSSGTWHLPQ